MDPLYLTTAIPFVNAAPHLGHALELVHADVLARHARGRGRPVRLLTGTDEHAPKNAFAAGDEDVPTFVARNALRFLDLAIALDVSFDDFIRTSADPRHRPAVEWIWRACERRGDLYRRSYEGLYCAGCEEFVIGPCGEHDAPPELVSEENWFFRLSRYSDVLNDIRVVPEERAAELRAFLEEGLRDISVSRPRARTRGWGIPVPGDPDQVVYVWFDALVNYVSALGLGGADDPLRVWWREGVERRHVIGKGIVRFHAIVWPAILRSAGLPLPSTLFVHDYVTVGSRKIGKSLGNAVDPVALVDRYGVDAVRWWLLREVPRLGEADFTEERLVDVANRDLARGIGNLVHRVAKLAEGLEVRHGEPLPGAAELPARIDAAIEAYDLRAASAAIIDAVAETNRCLEHEQPWTVTGVERARRLGQAVATLRVLVAELAAFAPGIASIAAHRVAGTAEVVYERRIARARPEPGPLVTRES